MPPRRPSHGQGAGEYFLPVCERGKTDKQIPSECQASALISEGAWPGSGLSLVGAVPLFNMSELTANATHPDNRSLHLASWFYTSIDVHNGGS